MTTPRIAIIIDTLNGGGAEKVCLTLTKALQNEQADVHLFVLKKKCDYIPPDNLTIHFLSEDAKLKLYKKSVQKALAGKLQSQLNALGKFDLHLSNLDECHYIVSLAELNNTYYVIHNSIEQTLKRLIRLGPIKYFRKRRLLSCLNNKRLITVSKGIENELKTSQIFQATSIRTIYNPLDLEEIARLAQEKNTLLGTERVLKNTPYIVHIGRFARQKRHDILFKALRIWLDKKDTSPPHTVLLTKESKKLRKAINNYRLSGNITVAGFHNNPYPIIQHAQALVLCSDYEGFGVVIAEALACGIPVVSTDCPHGPNELLTDKLAQYLVEPNNAQALQETLEKAINQTEDFKDNPILKQLEMQNIAQQYLELLLT